MLFPFSKLDYEPLLQFYCILCSNCMSVTLSSILSVVFALPDCKLLKSCNCVPLFCFCLRARPGGAQCLLQALSSEIIPGVLRKSLGWQGSNLDQLRARQTFHLLYSLSSLSLFFCCCCHCFCLVCFGGVLGLTPASALREQSWWCSGDHIKPVSATYKARVLPTVLPSPVLLF